MEETNRSEVLYFSRSETKTILRISWSFPGYLARMLTIRNERGKISIVMTLYNREEATHVPLATYQSMENAVADMDEVQRVLSKNEVDVKEVS